MMLGTVAASPTDRICHWKVPDILISLTETDSQELFFLTIKRLYRTVKPYPITVAIAAPAAPSPATEIRIGSSIMLTTAPPIVLIIKMPPIMR